MGNSLLWDLKRRIELLEGSGGRKYVRAATATALADAYTYAAGVYTADADGALGDQDDVTLAVGDRLLLKDESDDENNGIVIVLDLGDTDAPWILRRTDDAFTSEQVRPGMQVFVSEGTTNGNARFILTTDDPIVLGTDGLTFDTITDSTLQDTLALATTGNGASLIGVEDSADYYTGADVEAVLAQLGPLLALVGASGANLVEKRTVTIGHADLTDADNGDPQTISVGAALPAGAFVIGAQAHLVTPFSGGTPVSLSLDVGGTDADALLAGIDALGTAGYYDTAGVKPTGNYSAQQIAAVFTIDGANNLAALDAGSVVIDLWYVIH